uniref:ORF3 protein n=1 Tax=Groundnut rosette virus TaxID=47740 RepID=A0A221S6K0_9TOMB|nr:ORF3 protein [Groundnut rosette virus]ASN64729.1 ORF3 protein [Groundnut rosette virus]ASN64730.1 ORF3 protein [Groundnut rosette virus]ASN64732.1 ORF3 protein [Groundnut rosette virus]ASN64734.1 ORF3 protein [Groundnut rosette virus]
MDMVRHSPLQRMDTTPASRGQWPVGIMSSVINVFASGKSCDSRGAPRSTVRRGHRAGAPRDKSRGTYTPSRRPKGGVHPAATSKDPNKNIGGPPAPAPHKEHRGPAIPGKDRGGVHTARTRRRARRSGGMDPRQLTAQPQQRWAETEIPTERRAKIDGLLPPLLDTLDGQIQGDAALLRYCVGAVKRELRRRRESVQPAHHVAASGGKPSPQLSNEAARNAEDLSGDGEGRAGKSVQQEVLHSGGSVPAVCADCGKPATNKW